MSFKRTTTGDKKSKKSYKKPVTGGAGSEGYKSRLLELLTLVEQEFDQLHAENVSLRERVEKLEATNSERHCSVDMESVPGHVSSEAPLPTSVNTPLRKIRLSGQNITRKLKTYTPSKKSRSGGVGDCAQVCEYVGHKDGVWQVAHSRSGRPLIATASADGSGCVWDPDSASLLVRYTGHTGSVNSVTFHPKEAILASASGDNNVHIWSGNTPQRGHLEKNRSFDSSGEEHCSDDDDGEMPTQQSSPLAAVRQPLVVLSAHKAPVISCDWMSEGKKLVSGSWDRTAKLWDYESTQVIHSLEGHDQELTHVCAHPSQQLLVTSSEDATFRLWDFRAPPIHSVNVFQGHSKPVNSAAFSGRELIVSSSDDHSIKIWDLRNMRAPVDSVRLECGVNRIAISQDEKGVLAVPLDNGHIKLYDLTGARLASLPRRNRQGHRRMVYSVAFSTDSCSLYSCGFDNKVLRWKIN